MFVKMTKIGRYFLPLIKDMGCFPSNFIPLDRGIVGYEFRVKHSMTEPIYKHRDCFAALAMTPLNGSLRGVVTTKQSAGIQRDCFAFGSQ